MRHLDKTRTLDRLNGQPADDDVVGHFIGPAIMIVAGATVIAVVLESVPGWSAPYAAAWRVIEWLAFVIFAGEYALRLWAAPVDRRGLYSRPVRGRMRYLASPMAVFDLLAFAPSLLGLVFPACHGVFNVVRLVAILKLVRYSTAMNILRTVVYQERRALWSVALLMLVMLVLCSSAMYLVENAQQPQVFSSIPASMWWGMATLTTVGYGDITPVTPIGKVFGSVIAMIGIGMFAMPAAILASGFAREMRKRDFVISWNLVAQVPLFEHLTAQQIADIADLLTHRGAIPGEVIFHQGDAGDGVYFVAEGALRVETAGRTFAINAGDFFGEIALLTEGERTATVRAATSCQLLFLASPDFHGLLDDNPDLKQNVERVAHERLEELTGEDQ
jgi:voltage-gated potassium channel